MAADVDPRNPGVEMWSSDSKGVRNIKGEVIRPDLKSFSVNMAVWWDGDLLRELLDKNRITKYDWEDDVCRPLMILMERIQIMVRSPSLFAGRYNR